MFQPLYIFILLFIRENKKYNLIIFIFNKILLNIKMIIIMNFYNTRINFRR